jgi:hypothetical protein
MTRVAALQTSDIDGAACDRLHTATTGVHARHHLWQKVHTGDAHVPQSAANPLSYTLDNYGCSLREPYQSRSNSAKPLPWGSCLSITSSQTPASHSYQ